MDKTEIKRRLEKLCWIYEEEKSLAELLAMITKLKAKYPILRSCQSVGKCITYIQQKKEACQQSREKCLHLLELVTDNAAYQVLQQRYVNNCTAEQIAEKLCYSLSNVFKLQQEAAS